MTELYDNADIQNQFGNLISNGWTRKEAIEAIHDTSGIDVIVIAQIVNSRG